MTQILAGLRHRIWGHRPPHSGLIGTMAALGLILSLPLLYVLARGLGAGTERWMRLLDGRIPTLLSRTLSLTLGVTVLSLVVGVALAWLVHRTDLPGRRLWQWLLALPLVIPPYVGAMTYIIVLGPRGWLRDLFGATPLNIYSFWGALLVLTASSYPYVFLLTGAAMKRMSRSYEEAGRSAGLGPWALWFRVLLPLLRPAMGAGGILVALYVLSDFGAVSTLRYSTFTTAIYYQMGSLDHVNAAVLSVVLIALTLLLLIGEGYSRRRRRFYQSKGQGQPAPLQPLGLWRRGALGLVLAVFLVAVALPLGVLLYWSIRGVMEGAVDGRFFSYTLNSLGTSAVAALIAMAAALPIIYGKIRFPSPFSRSVDRLAYGGYALPGVIVALGLVFLFNTYVPWLYGTVAVLILAYVIRFLPQSLQATESAFSQVSPSLEEAGQSLGLKPWQVLRRVTVPLITPGLFAGGAFVFVSALKELPATLLLRPAGLDTLAVRIWMEAHEGFYSMAAPGALVIVLISLLPLRWMLSKY